MMKKNKKTFFMPWIILALTWMSCQFATNTTPTPAETTPSATSKPTAIPTPLPPRPVEPGAANPNEPVRITGDIPYTSPFFLNTLSAPFVLLEDEAGFVHRDLEFAFPLEGQVIGPVEILEDKTLRYSLSLPSVPQGTYVDVDNDGEQDTGVQVFAVAYWSNTWGDPFLEPRDGTGWSTAYASTITDPERDYEIIGGILVVWAPDDQQAFPTGFGEDGLLFTEDDPTAPIPAGYNIVDLNTQPFKIYKEAQPQITLNEGEVAVNDYSKMGYAEAFEALFQKVSREYPFTKEKRIDWQALHDEFAPRVARARNKDDFYRALRDFANAIPDAHVGLSFNPDVFYEEQGGSFGMVLAELSDGRVIVTKVLPGYAADKQGIQVGAEITQWNGKPIGEAISQVTPYLGPYSTEHHKRLQQVIFLTRVPPYTEVTITYKNPGATQAKTTKMTAEVDYDSLFAALPEFSLDELSPPIEAEVLDDSGLGYIRLTTFSDDYNLLASLWNRYIQDLIDNDIPGLIIDVRVNFGGNSSLATDFAAYFFDEEMTISRSSYYNETSGKFEYEGLPTRIKPAPLLYEGPIAVLVSPYCISACEGYVYALTQRNRATVVGHYPTAGAYGEVGRGQYNLPGDISMQFPTGRTETMDGKLLIEGEGIPLDITVPVTEDSALGRVDAVLEAAVQALLKKIK
jgi:C-terminal processing protease CtpA/Prc